LLVIIGYVVVCVGVFGGFAMNGGHLAALLQPLELVMIGGGALGAFLVGNNAKTIKATLAACRPCSRARATPRTCTWS
jgi:chemotaxis protein MotA